MGVAALILGSGVNPAPTVRELLTMRHHGIMNAQPSQMHRNIPKIADLFYLILSTNPILQEIV